MGNVYWFCAVVGGTILVCQFVLTLIGFAGDSGDVDAGGHDFDVGGHDFDTGGHDFDAGGHDAAGGDHAAGHSPSVSNWIFGVLTFRTLVAGMAFFGLTGLSMQENGADAATTLLSALSAGAAAVFIVFWLMRSLRRLNVDGTVRIQRALGATGTVYLSIPGGRSGAGKVHVSVLNRMMEYKAVTSNDPLPTGSRVVVVNVVGNDTVEVRPAESLQTTAETA